LDIKVGIEGLPVVWGNAEMLRRVFFNLLGNAVKYHDKPQIIINIACQQIRARSLGRYCDISVTDNGPGIPAEDCQRVFSMFSRSAANAQGKEGLGVGLAVVQRIVELHYGQVRVESTLGQGTKFVLCLPMEHNDLVG
jgi:signal transduction histidine kinase